MVSDAAILTGISFGCETRLLLVGRRSTSWVCRAAVLSVVHFPSFPKICFILKRILLLLSSGLFYPESSEGGGLAGGSGEAGVSAASVSFFSFTSLVNFRAISNHALLLLTDTAG